MASKTEHELRAEMRDALDEATRAAREMAAGTALGVPVLAYTAFVARSLWGWFVTPAFGVPAPRLAVLFGLLVFAGMLLDRVSPRAREEREPRHSPLEVATACALAVTASWALGYAAHLCDEWSGY